MLDLFDTTGPCSNTTVYITHWTVTRALLLSNKMDVRLFICSICICVYVWVCQCGYDMYCPHACCTGNKLSFREGVMKREGEENSDNLTCSQTFSCQMQFESWNPQLSVQCRPLWWWEVIEIGSKMGQLSNYRKDNRAKAVALQAWVLCMEPYNRSYYNFLLPFHVQSIFNWTRPIYIDDDFFM